MKSRLSMAFEDLRGKDGNVVIRKGRNGLVLTPWVTPSNPRTGAQMSVRDYFTRASKAYEALTISQATAWKNYANTITKTDPISGKQYHPTAANVFVEYAAKFLQLNPNGTIPLAPPSGDFLGDSITLLVESESPGVLKFTASGANASGVTTELLVQQVANANRRPNANNYRHAAWKAFTSGSLIQNVNVPAGYYAAGYRFVKNSTGQATEMIPLPVTTVSLSVSQGSTSNRRKAA